MQLYRLERKLKVVLQQKYWYKSVDICKLHNVFDSTVPFKMFVFLFCHCITKCKTYYVSITLERNPWLITSFRFIFRNIIYVYIKQKLAVTLFKKKYFMRGVKINFNFKWSNSQKVSTRISSSTYHDGSLIDAISICFISWWFVVKYL